jgi:hypothetical protein
MNKRIGDILIEKELITKETLKQALAIQKQTGKRLGQVLVDEHFITDDDLTDAISERLDIAKLSLESIVIAPELLEPWLILWMSSQSMRSNTVPNSR